MGLQGVKTMENHKTASPTSRHGCLHKEVTYERFLSLGFEWENFGVLHRWSLMEGGRSREEVVHGGWPVIGYYRRGLSPSAQPPTWRPRGSHLGLVSTLRLFWHEWLYPPLMNVIPSPKYRECEYTFFVPAIRDPYLVGLLNRLNECVALKYQHIV